MIRLRSLWAAIALGAVILFGPTPARAAGGIEAALNWLRAQQQADGGFSNGFAPESDIGATADAVIAILAAGESPDSWSPQGRSPLDFLEERAVDADTPGLAAKVVLAAVAADRDPRAQGGVDMVRGILSGLDAATGLFGGGAYDSALAILALHAAGEAAPEEAIAGLIATRLPDGSYAFDASQIPGSGDSNTTALVVQALLAAGAADEVGESLAYFRATQNPDGGWTYQKPSAFGEATDANSTALVIQALTAAGEDLEAWNQPLGVLIGLQQPSGAFAFNADTPGDNLLATVQVLPALAGADMTDLANLARGSASTAGTAPSPGPVLIAAAVIVVIVLGVAAILGRTNR
jgi:hypothetical protein